MQINFNLFRISFIMLLLMSCTVIHAQSLEATNDKTFTAFTNVFFGSKNLKPDWNKIGEQLLDSLGVSTEEYAAIVNDRNINTQRSNEHQIISNAVLKEEARQKQLQQESLMMLCKKFGISFYKYEELLNLYRTDISFQQRLLPYFSTYMEKLAKK